jgi:hypothetical protein
VVHVSWFEADAYARWAGKRLPTEAEWEKAASWDPSTGTKRLYPWGDDPPDGARANLDQLAFRPTEVGAYPAGASAYGSLGMIGDVWEWTASEFSGYPGFESFPLQGVLGDLLRLRLQGAAWQLVGFSPGRDPQHVPQLGLPDPPPAIRGISLCEIARGASRA